MEEEVLLKEEKLMPIYAADKKNWNRASYVGLKPYVVQKFKSRELLMIYVYADIVHYVYEHSFARLVVTKEYMANYLRISEEELEFALQDLLAKDLVILRELGDNFISLYPVF